MLDDLSEKVAVVTGASRGIGRAIAIAPAKAGADVVVNYRTHADRQIFVCMSVQGISSQ